MAPRATLYAPRNILVPAVDEDMPHSNESVRPLVTVRAYEDRAESARKLSERNAAAANAATRQVMYLERRSSESVEMPSMDTLTLNRGSNGQIKPPAVYFGGKPGKSTPGVVTINEYPTDRRPSPNKLDFLPHTNGQHNGTHQYDDPQGALSSELHSTLSRSNRRQLSEPMPTPPPPPLSPHLQENHHEPPRQAKDQEREPVRVEVNGDSADARSRARTKLQAIHALARARSPPPVVAKKPIAIPYTELVNARNQLLFDDALRIQVGFEPESSAEHSPAPNSPQIIYSPPVSKSTAIVNGANRAEMIMDALSNKVTIKFPNGKSASSAGAKGLDSLLATAPPPQTACQGILKSPDHDDHPKHKTVIQQKSITFGEM